MRSKPQTFIPDVWPDGDPSALGATASAWQRFASTMNGTAGGLLGPTGVVGGQQIPEGGSMTSAISELSQSLSGVASEAAKLATQTREFADDVENTQNAIRDLLDRISPSGFLDGVKAVFSGDALEELKEVADDIKSVRGGYGRQAEARRDMLQIATGYIDDAIVSVEKWARREFPRYLGDYVGNALATAPDPRQRRGIRHGLTGVLAVALSAVLAGAQSFVAIAEWAADAAPEVLARLGVTGVAPCESTIRRCLQRLAPDELDQLIGAWMWLHTSTIAGRRVIAFDGKTLRGARDATGSLVHLLAGLCQQTGTVLAQLAVDVKTNEIPMLRKLLDTFDITGAVITADALHYQRDTAEHIIGRSGHYIFTVKDNHPTLRRQLKNLPWKRSRSSTPASSTITAAPPNAYSSYRDHRGNRVPRRRAGAATDPHGHRPQDQQASHRSRLPPHLAVDRRRQARPDRRLAARTLGDREQAALGPRRHLRPGPLADPHRRRTPGHGNRQEYSHQRPAAQRPYQHRRDASTPRAQFPVPAQAPILSGDGELVFELLDCAASEEKHAALERVKRLIAEVTALAATIHLLERIIHVLAFETMKSDLTITGVSRMQLRAPERRDRPSIATTTPS